MNLQNIDLTEKVKWESLKEQDLFFIPNIKPILLERRVTKWNMLYRKDKNRNAVAIAVNTKAYGLTENSVIHKAIINHPLGLKLDKKRSINSGNCHFNLVYDIKELDGTDSLMKLIIENSYNGGTKFSIDLALYRNDILFSIPIEKKIIQKATKHYVTNFKEEIKDTINSWLDQVVRQEIFDEIGKKISLMKETKDIEIPIGLFSKCGFRYAILLIGLINTYYTNKVVVRHKGIEYNLTNDDGLIPFIDIIHGFYVTSNKKRDFSNQLDMIAKIKYDQVVSNKWELYNMLIRAVSIVSYEKNRSFFTKHISKYFMK